MATAARTDEELRQDVSDHLFWDGRIDSGNIEVRIIGTVAVLGGTVPTYLDKKWAEDNARSVTGITDVDNRLSISFEQGVRAPSDMNIEDNIRSAILWNPRLDSTRISVSVGSGIVTLNGTVDSYAQKVYAGNVAMNVSGVKDVVNEIAVAPMTAIDDEAIRLDLIDAMQRSRALNWANINVDVANGTVTLSGSVNDYIALRTAERLAFYTRGVVDVNNQLKIK